MGKIYELETQLRNLCTSPNENSVELYTKISELVRRILKRNQSHLGPDIEIDSLVHEMASYILVRLCNGTLKPIEKWSGYIRMILPRMLKNNAEFNSSECINCLYLGIDNHAMIEMNHAGSLSIIKDAHSELSEFDLPNLSNVLNSWMDENIRYLDKDSRYYYNLRLSIIMSLTSNSLVMFRLPEAYRNDLILYLNKAKVHLASILLQDLPESPYDQVTSIAEYESDDNGDDC